MKGEVKKRNKHTYKSKREALNVRSSLTSFYTLSSQPFDAISIETGVQSTAGLAFCTKMIYAHKKRWRGKMKI